MSRNFKLLSFGEEAEEDEEEVDKVAEVTRYHIQLNFVMSKWSGPRKILRHRNGSK